MTVANHHADRMRRKKAVVDGKIGIATTARGVFVLNTGTGKGKSSAAFGVLARALGHGMKACVVQFVKNRSDTGEVAFFGRQPNVVWHVMGAGFTWETQDAGRDAAAANTAWEEARRVMADPTVDLVILDEFTYTLKHRWLDIDAVLATIRARPPQQHLIVTGRAAPHELVAAADTVSDMTLVKHAFHAGVQAMPGIEW